jgi:aminopeptidase-like protein
LLAWLRFADRLLNDPNGEYAEYHSSADNLSLLRPESLAHSLAVLQRIIAVIEGDAVYCSRNPKGEPQLGRRGLYGALDSAPRASTKWHCCGY